MDWAQFIHPVSHMCFTGAVVVSWSLTQDVAGSSLFNDKYFYSVKTFRKNCIIYYIDLINKFK